MGKRLVEILALEMPNWPKDASNVWQMMDGVVCYATEGGRVWDLGLYSKSNEGAFGEPVTKEMWMEQRAHMDQIRAGQESLMTGAVQPMRAFTESDIRAAFAAGANWVRGGIEEGAVEYVNKLKGDV